MDHDGKFFSKTVNSSMNSQEPASQLVLEAIQ